MAKKNYQIALTGNPNSGKTSLFNALTGLNQKVGNFPGVTVDKKTGKFDVSPGIQAHITDLPGTYSLYPKSADEYVAYETLLNPAAKSKPDLIIIVADAANLKRNLLFCSQIADLKKPVILALSMMDIARKKGIDIDIEGLEREIGLPVVVVNPRKNKGLGELKKRIAQIHNSEFTPPHNFIDIPGLSETLIKTTQSVTGVESTYGALHL